MVGTDGARLAPAPAPAPDPAPDPAPAPAPALATERIRVQERPRPGAQVGLHKLGKGDPPQEAQALRVLAARVGQAKRPAR